VAARPAPRTVIAPALDRLAGSAEAAKPAEDQPIRDQRNRDPDPGPHGPASVAGRSICLAAFGRRWGASGSVISALSSSVTQPVVFWWKCDRGGQAIERGPGAFVGAAFSGGRWQRLVVWRRLVGLREDLGSIKWRTFSRVRSPVGVFASELR
jgi:hypothetical protein